MSFFTDPSVTTGTKALEIVFVLIGMIVLYTGIKNFLDKENKARIGTGVFWCALGIVLALGRWLPPLATGILVVVMTIPAILRQVKPGNETKVEASASAAVAKKLGAKVFIPAFSIGIFAIAFALLTSLGALVGVAVGVVVAIVLLLALNCDNKPVTFMDDSTRLPGTVGPMSMLPMLLASLGAIFTAAGVGDVIASLVGHIIPKGNVAIGMIVFGVGMALFTVIMGNAFAAITVLTVGIGAPFVLAYGANPVVVGMVALTCGYCGTLLTPMAANFNVVPVAMLEMKDKYGVIKNQIFVASVMLVLQIVYMLLFA